MAGLIPLLIALTIVETAAHPRDAGSAWAFGPALGVIAVSLALWFALSAVVGAWLGAQRARARTWLDRWDIAAQAMLLGGFAVLCYELGWASRSQYVCPALAPWVIANLIHWWNLTPTMNTATGGTAWTRSGMVWHHFRFSLLPLAIALPILDGCVLIARTTPIEQWLMSTYGQTANIVGQVLLAAATVALLPWLLVRMWGARPLDSGPLRQELTAACQRAGVPIGNILRWPVPGGRVYNAMVLGVIPRLRYVLFTDDLLRDFTTNERIAVLGHELGHARHHHLWLYLLFALATAFVSWSLRTTIDGAIADWPLSQQIHTDVRHGLIALVLLAIQWRLLFGYLSRACERQADLAGATLVGDGNVANGAPIMREALLAVARLARIDPQAPSWRHYSLAQRAAWLDHVASQPALAAQHHRLVARTAQFLGAAAGMSLALAWIFRP